MYAWSRSRWPVSYTARDFPEVRIYMYTHIAYVYTCIYNVYSRLCFLHGEGLP